jgi:AcrR family transcriptional regulator
VKTVEREEARRLRAVEGLSVREITRRLGVSKGSVSLWVRDVPLTDAQRARLQAANPRYGGQNAGAATNARRARVARSAWQEEGRELARARGSDFAAGCMLYWAEGSKTRNVAQLSNSDPEVVRFFVDFLRRHFDVPDRDIRVTCNLFADHLPDQERIEQFWLDVLQLPPECLRKSIVNVYSKYSQKKRKNMLPYGTCRVSVHRTRLIQTIYGAIQEYGGFERPEWLD